ncbi:nSTAND1 domain-containing NTPase [Alteromonas gilva]|uniref:Winged helix-turn-helix domain-containing protein n=1 Tax=Alteromonas gilva TaxID=2987522 RepID=A0ABT5L4Q3_9ALTE|nr:winged helix-turn-helix domain-containing protein [Alteromonas gilva]MDC8830842.1 winged helix-turn-helix domain-containing protein [Alteromonas gilva]
MDTSQFFLGDWQVSPSSNSLRLGKTVSVVEPKAMDVLLLLCQQAGEVLSADTIIQQCWGTTDVGDNPIHKAITQLRKALGDKATSPIYIETIRKRGYRVIADVVFPEDDSSRAQKAQWQGGSPFLGLQAYSEKDAGVFFGRQKQIAELLGRINHQIEQGRAFTLLLGPSGSGKSSLIHAGLIPRLTDPKGVNGIRVISYATVDFADIDAERLWLDLASHLLDWDIEGEPLFFEQSAQQLAVALQTDMASVCEHCQSVLSAYAEFAKIAHPRFMLVLDRLEVLLDSPQFSAADREQLLQLAEQLACSNAVIVLSACRNDFYPKIANFPVLLKDKAKGAHFDLAPPSPYELSQMIRLPAIAAGLTWSKDNAQGVMLDELITMETASHPDALPLLQYTLQELYVQRDGNELQISVYKSLGGIEGAIGHKAEQLFKAMDADKQKNLPQILLLLITLSPDGNNLTSRTARWDELKNKPQRDFVQTMVENRLFVSHLQHDEPCFRVAHEALLRRWPRVQEWINAHQDSLAIKTSLLNQAEQWCNEKRNPAYLLADGKPLQQALALRDHSGLHLQAQELALIKASQARASNIRWLKRATMGMLMVLTIMAVFFSLQSQHAQQLAEAKRQEAESLLGFMVGEFADKLRSVGRMDLLDGISNKAMEYFATADQQENPANWWLTGSAERSFKARFQQALTLQALAEVAYSRDKLDEAATGFTEAHEQMQALLAIAPENVELVKMLGVNAFWRGQLDYNASRWQGAEAGFTDYLTYSQQLLALEPDNPEAITELSYAHNSLGSLALERLQYQKALTAFEHSLKLKKQVLTVQPDNTLLKTDIADTYSWLATASNHLGQYRAARKHAQQGQRILQKLLDAEPTNPYMLESLAFMLLREANLLIRHNELASAATKAVEAHQLFELLVAQDPDNTLWQRAKARQQMKMLRINRLLPADERVFTDNEEQALLENLLAVARDDARVTVDYADYLQLTGNWAMSDKVITRLGQQLAQQNTAQQNASRRLLHSKYYLLKAAGFAHDNEDTLQQQACVQAEKVLAPVLEYSLDLEILTAYVTAVTCAELTVDISQYLTVIEREELSLNTYPLLTRQGE